MNIERITYRRLVNTGNYENETVELTAIVEEHEDAIDVFDRLVSTANNMLIGRDKRKPLSKDDF